MRQWYERQVATTLVGLGLVLSYLVVVGLPFPNEDLFVAFCSGRDTLQGLLAAPNQWAYTIPASVWVDQSWLAHLLFYLSYLETGPAGPILIKGALVALTLGLVFARCRALGASANSSIIALSLGALALAPSANARAHLFGMLALVILAQLLTLPSHRNRTAQMGSVAVIAVWSNVHGSFMLGFFLLALRTLIELIAAGRFWWVRRGAMVRGGSRAANDPEGTTERSPADSPAGVSACSAGPVGWLIAAAAAALAMALANPYGPENLAMPFRQFFGSERTVPWTDWLPLLSQGAVTELRAFKARSAVPVLVFLGWLGIQLITLVLLLGAKGACQRFTEKLAARNPAMEILLPLTMIPLMFKFGRLVVFAVPILVPVVAVLMTSVAEAAAGRFPAIRRHMSDGVARRAAVVLASLWVVCLGFLFYRNVAILLLPENPRARVRPDSGIASQLLSYNFVGEEVAEFLARNRLNGRIFCNLSISDFLLLRVPGTRVFMDLRAHSAYPARIIEAYHWLILSGQTDLKQAIAILDRYRVEQLVLDSCDDECRKLVRGLLSTRQWGCIYQEKNGCIFVLARADSPAFVSLLDGSHPNTLWYETPDDRAVAESVAWVFGRGSLPRAMRDRLESVAQRRPDPDLYALIATGTERPVPCLDDDLKTFFQSEFRRLTGENYLVAGGERSVVMSTAKVAEILEADACHCSRERSCETYAAARRRILQVAEDLRRRYRPF